MISELQTTRIEFWILAWHRCESVWRFPCAWERASTLQLFSRSLSLENSRMRPPSNNALPSPVIPCHGTSWTTKHTNSVHTLSLEHHIAGKFGKHKIWWIGSQYIYRNWWNLKLAIWILSAMGKQVTIYIGEFLIYPNSSKLKSCQSFPVDSGCLFCSHLPICSCSTVAMDTIGSWLAYNL